ncbi:DNA repair protein RAD14 [Plectosphaerella cucumerina]|uniref:DNA repair protein RAD14 n=1 Tax=Plectosphaerella cucumerina TaxID=40658 RepID=A0A8K0T9M9_9PEZI|nr:DNA repair protein RAD14 [Plectosphaerella cucumerina]
MERASTPPAQRATRSRARTPPTPEVTRRIEENRLKAKALRDQHEAARRAAGAPELDKTPSGFVATDTVHIPNTRKRAHAAISTSQPPTSGTGPSENKSLSTNRDGRVKTGEEAPLKAAKSFAKFVDYNMSAMTDTRGGFLSTEDDPNNPALAGPRPKPGDQPPSEARPQGMTAEEWQRLQTLRRLERTKAGPFEPSLSVLRDASERAVKKCRECASPEIDFVWVEVFRIYVCAACKEKFPDKYSLLTKTECREDYLLTEPELRDADLLPHLSRPNPHKSHWHDMMLFLRCQVEDYAFHTKWGSSEALDAEFERRQDEKRARKDKKFREKLTDLKRKTRTEAFRRQAAASKSGGGGPANFGDAVGNGRHVHEWGRAIENEEGMTVKTCTGCGMEVEELEF